MKTEDLFQSGIKKDAKNYKQMSNLLIYGLITILMLFLSPRVYAHPGNTDSLGCHTCSTNCTDWGLYYGEYHCHDSDYYSSPYTTPYVPPPSCPFHSHYDSISDSCKCSYGYVVSGDRCISQDDWCQNQFGFNSRYNTLSDSCECSYGYVFEGNKCVSGDQYCSNRYGYSSSYDSLSENCKCRSGYVFNKSGNKCISEDDWCQEQFGYSSEYDSLEDNCVCSDGYRFDGDECVLDTSDYRPAPLNIKSSPTPKLTPYPTPKSTPKPSITTDKTQFENPSPTTEPTKQYNPPYNLQTELTLNSKGEEVKILQSALATDKEIYPEGVISGFFGMITDKAVKRFQNRHGLEQTGVVNSQTLSKFNEVFGEQKMSTAPTPSPEPKKEHIFIKVWQFITSFWRH